MRDDDERAVPGKILQGSEYMLFSGGVEAGGGLVEDDDGAVLQEGAGEAEAVALAVGDGGAALAKTGVEAGGKRAVPVQQARLLQGGAAEGVSRSVES